MNAATIIHNTSPGASAVLSGGIALTGTLIGQLNPYLQAGAYVVSMAVGICALIKLWRNRR